MISKTDKTLRIISIILGLASFAFFLVDILIFTKLQPKMVAFDQINPTEEGLIHWVGISMVVFFAFCLLSIFQTTNYLKKSGDITLFSLLLIAIGVISLMFIFGDIALLSDIGKQYKYGLDQPEWALLYVVIVFQFITAIVFTLSHFFGFSKGKQVSSVIQDCNIFIVVHFIGVICGLIGLSTTSLRFLFPGATRKEHIILNLIALFPYVLVVGYWLIAKLQEKNREWFDEKQRQDIGKSAFFTTGIEFLLMTSLFFFNYHNLNGVISLLWFPLYLFSAILFFSLGNLFLFRKI